MPGPAKDLAGIFLRAAAFSVAIYTLGVNRRGFLAALAAGLVLDPERALYIPGRKLISIPVPSLYRVLEEWREMPDGAVLRSFNGGPLELTPHRHIPFFASPAGCRWVRFSINTAPVP